MKNFKIMLFLCIGALTSFGSMPALEHNEAGQPTVSTTPLLETSTGEDLAQNLPDNRISDHLLIRNMSAADGTSFEFSKLMSEMAASTNKAQGSTDHTAYARIYFDDLYNHGNRDLKKTLAMLTFQLGKLMDKIYWSGTKKDVAVGILLRRFFVHINRHIVHPEQKKKAYELYKHLQAAATPAIRGMRERLRDLPWKTIIGAGLATGGALWALRSNLAARAASTFVGAGRLMKHASDSMDEAKRHRTAFFQKVLHVHKKNKSDIRPYDATNPDFEKDYAPLVEPHIQPNGHTIYKYKLIEPIQNGTELVEWVEAPRGITEKAVHVLENLTPLTNQAAKQMEASAKNQQEWFKAHRIRWDNVNQRFMMVKVDKEDGSSQMEYLSEDGNTYLPHRNIIEQVIRATEKLGDPSTGTGRLIGGIAYKMEESIRNADDWKRSNGIAPNERPKWDERGMYFEGTVRSDDPTANGRFKHYPGKNIVEQITGAIDRLHEDQGPGRLVSSIADAMTDSAKGYARQLYGLGVSTDPTDQHSIKKGYRKHMDPDTQRFYWLAPNADGTPGTDHSEANRLHEDTSPTADLFRGIGVLARKKDPSALHGLASTLGDPHDILDRIGFFPGGPLGIPQPFIKSRSLVDPSAPTIREKNDSIDAKIKRRENKIEELQAEIKKLNELGARNHLSFIKAPLIGRSQERKDVIRGLEDKRSQLRSEQKKLQVEIRQLRAKKALQENEEKTLDAVPA